MTEVFTMDESNSEWCVAYHSWVGLAGPPGIDLKFGFSSKAEALVWARLNVKPIDFVGVFEGTMETVKSFVEVLNTDDGK